VHDEWFRRTADGDQTAPERVRRFRLVVTEGARAGLSVESQTDRVAIGAHPSNDLVLDDSTVSRFHCELAVLPEGVLLRDCGSRNGTLVDGLQAREVFLRSGSLITVGGAVVRFELGRDSNRIELQAAGRFGSMASGSVAMRAAFAQLERAAGSDATLLLEGETGTGKGVAAEAVHKASRRRERPFMVVDCSAIPGQLLESELFGHEKGAFTGADRARVGAFEEASGGTVFLDEVGELPPELQPKLLRALENRTVKRLGANAHHAVDIRLVAATNRDLKQEVNAGRFRADLFFRLAVLRVRLPPLRERPEDVPVLAAAVLQSLGATPRQIGELCTPALFDLLRGAAWPGNVRELRNYLERCLVYESVQPVGDAPPAAGGLAVDSSAPFAAERQRIITEFERRYVAELLERHQGRTVQAAEAAGINRVYLYRLARRHGIR